MKKLSFILATLLLLLYVSCDKSDDDKYPYHVTYTVTSETPAIIVAYYDNGAVVSDEVQSGWSKDAVVDKGYATISASALDNNTVRVKVRIIRDGKVVAENEGLTVSLTDL